MERANKNQITRNVYRRVNKNARHTATTTELCAKEKNCTPIDDFRSSFPSVLLFAPLDAYCSVFRLVFVSFGLSRNVLFDFTVRCLFQRLVMLAPKANVHLAKRSVLRVSGLAVFHIIPVLSRTEPMHTNIFTKMHSARR